MLGRNLSEAQKRAAPLLTCADDIEIERAIRTLQVIKGKTYAKALLKENGKVLNEISFDIGIGLMFKKHSITQEELHLWEAFAVLEWEDLPKKFKLEFFYSLDNCISKRILALKEPQQRETATRKEFYRLG